jgi:hypothetical protein
MASEWTRYTYLQPHDVPLADGDCEDWDEAAVVAAGFDPADEEVSICTLTEEWNGHPAGSRVVTTLTVSGHPFAVEVAP